jgi:probable F420-dependent oxidoreductase
MHIGCAIPFSHLTPVDYIGEAARYLESTGFHSMWVPEHVLFFPDYASRYPYSPSGRVPGDPEGVLDPFATLTFVAAQTSRIRLGTGVCLVPQRQPVYTAKAVADLDYLSRGRVDFGVGIGWLEEEFNALGMSFSARARRTLEYIDAMRALWTQAPASFEGETVHIARAHFNPKPVQKPHPPIHFGGESAAALARVASHGQGWYGYDLDPAGVEQKLAELDSKLRAAGRARQSVTVSIGPNRHPVTRETVAAYAALGVDQLIVPVFATTLDDLKRRIERVQNNAGIP